MSILCVLTPEIKPVKPGFLPAHKPGFTGLKTGGLPGFSGTRVPGLHSLKPMLEAKLQEQVHREKIRTVEELQQCIMEEWERSDQRDS